MKENRVRIDKWLWAVRIFKTRRLVVDACNAGKVKIDAKSVKPSKDIFIDDIIDVQKGIIKHKIKVLDLLEKRVSAKLVNKYMEDLTPEKELINQKAVRESAFFRPKGDGRPTKKERRLLDNLRKGF